MNNFNEVRENIIDVLDELDEQLSEIIDGQGESEQPSKQSEEVKVEETENRSYLDTLWAKTYREMDKIKQSIFHIGKNNEE